MKSRILFLFTVLILFHHRWSLAQSNSSGSNRPIEEQATELTRKMREVVQFNEYEYIQIKKLNETRLHKIKSTRVKYSKNRAVLARRVKQINNEFDVAVKQLLSPAQKKNYALYKKKEGQAIFTSSR
jgi:hypothetical protein